MWQCGLSSYNYKNGTIKHIVTGGRKLWRPEQMIIKRAMFLLGGQNIANRKQQKLMMTILQYF